MTTFQQLDLFEDIAPRLEWEALLASSQKAASTLEVGDIVHVKWGNGVEFTGVFSGAIGFWNGVPELQEYRWIYSDGRYRHFTPSRDEWVYLGHDDSYTAPSKDDITELLIERLRAVPFRERLDTFRRFEDEYPHLSQDYHLQVSGAWKTAIVAVSGIDDVIHNKDHWSARAKFPKQVIEYITSYVFPLPPEQWMEEVHKIRWAEDGWKDDRGKHAFVRCVPRKTFSCYQPLFEAVVTQCKTSKQFITLLEIWGSNGSAGTVTNPKRSVWIE